MNEPILTRAEVEGLRDYVWSKPVINTITQAVELVKVLYSAVMSGDDDIELLEATEAFLARYDGEK